MNIVFDWDGTLATTKLAEKASIRRGKSLGKTFDNVWLKAAMKNDSHFATNKELIEKYTGIKDEGLQTEIMTNLFQYHYFAIANEMKEKCLLPKIKRLLQNLHKNNNTLFIATTMRTDIVKPILKNLHIAKYFTEVVGNDARLTRSKQDMLEQLKKEYGQIHYMIGDKPSDVEAGLSVGAKGVLVTWGTHQEYKNASHTVHSVEELNKLFS